MKEKATTEVRRQLSQLLLQSLKGSIPWYHLALLRQQLENRRLTSGDQAALRGELGKLELHQQQLHTQMLTIYDLLTQSC